MVKLLHKSKSTKRQPLPLSSHPSYLKTRALLPRIQLPMAYDQRLRKPLLQLPDQGRQADLLRLRPRVLCTALRVQPAFVADADAVTVVVAAVRPYQLQRTPPVDGPVARDVVVIPDVPESPVTDVVPATVLKAKALPLAGGRAMENNQRNRPHHDMHDATPNTPARAVATVTIILSTRLHTFFFFVVVSLTLVMDN